MSYTVLSAILVLSLAAFACGSTFTLPEAPTAGPEQTTPLTVSAPGSGETRLKLSFGAGELNMAPGAHQLVEGTATYSIPDLKPQVSSTGSDVEIKAGDLKSIPYPQGVKNKWDLKLGSSPLDLTINAGAYTGRYELGGLALSGLTVKDGASDVELSFSQPNKTELAILRYETGASNVKLTGLANANFSTLIFNSGAGDYTLDFSGALKRDATVTVSSGISNLILVVPEDVRAEVTIETGASNVSAGSGWRQSGDVYIQDGSGPKLTFIVKTAAGNLTLTH